MRVIRLESMSLASLSPRWVYLVIMTWLGFTWGFIYQAEPDSILLAVFLTSKLIAYFQSPQPMSFLLLNQQFVRDEDYEV